MEPDATGRPHFVGYVSADHAFAGRFELVGERRGGGGTSNVRQGGSVLAGDGETVRLSQLSFGDLSAVPHYVVHLRVYRGDQLVGTAEIAK